ncbi:hypothetical protein [Fodinicola feengrottensis]|uniref:hypothetical protein n=1 Tax=Fodinicola feengrottensis TaxID=435914 RepID=UPI0013D0AF49|nr:hypothetical protein [Fodinicola feengrottensis]
MSPVGSDHRAASGTAGWLGTEIVTSGRAGVPVRAGHRVPQLVGPRGDPAQQ